MGKGLSAKTSIFVNIQTLIKRNTNNFQPLEVVDRGSETQPQVVKNLKKLT